MAADTRQRSGSTASPLRELAHGRLYGRERELDELWAVVDGASSRGGASIVRGEAGIGKSSLVGLVTEHARGLGMQVLSAVGVQSEGHLAYAGLHQVVRPVIQFAQELPPRQSAALLGVFAMADAGDPEVFFIALATLELLSDAAARGPVLVVIEDAQWLDDASASVLAFAARRLEPNIAMLVAIRDGYESPFDDAGLSELRVPALAEGAAATLLDTHAPELGPSVRDWIIEEAGGNPLALVELPIALKSGHLESGTARAGPVPLTARLEHAFAAQESSLPQPTRSLLLVAAADDGGAHGGALGELLRAAGILDREEIDVDALAPAVAARLVEVDETSVRFRHPLVRSAIYQAASITRRQAAHAALATALSDEPDRAVWHRAAGVVAPDDDVASDLVEVAQRARRRGAFVVAIAAQQRAAVLSDPEDRGRRILGAAEIAFEFGRSSLGQQLLAEAERLELSRPERTQLSWLREVYVSASWSGSAKVATFVGMAEEIRRDGRSDLALTTLLGIAERCWWGNPDAKTSAALIAAAERIDPAKTDPRFLQILACADPVTRSAFVLEHLSRTPVDAGDPDGMAILGVAASILGAYAESLPFLEAAIDVFRAQGRLALLAQARVSQAWSAVHLARASLAVSAAEEATRLGRETGQLRWAAGGHYAQAAVAAERGHDALAEFHIREADAILAPIGASSIAALVEFVRGRGAVAHQRYEEGIEYLRRPLDERSAAFHPYIGAWGLSDLVESAAHTGETVLATDYLQQLESLAATTSSPFWQAQAAYARPFVAGDDHAESLYRAATERDLVNWPCYRGRMLLRYGRWLRRQRRVAESRAPLRTARDLFDGLAFTELAENARRELRASGETSRSRTPEAREQLTPQELQIAQLAAEGLSNREIGQQLYISHRTVGYHLHRIFPKLGITSRAQLHAAVLEQPSRPV
jgi:DNA-binding CsgD family transcriptional regulator